MNPSYAKYLIEKTKEDYEKIAEHFSLKRRFFWPELEKIKNYIKDGDKVLDWGCGHGRLLPILKDKKIKYIGTDTSPKILEIAKKNFLGHDFRLFDKLSLPLSDSFFNVICCIATIHHIPSKQLRLKLFKEFKRVLKKDGVLILTSWYFYKGKKKIVFKYAFKWILDKIFKKDTDLDFKDLFFPWKNEKGEIIAHRYFHAFSKKELGKLVEGAGFKIKELEIVERGKKFANIFLVAIKQ